MGGRGGTRAGASSRYVALLRGINVGGHRRLPMADLRAIVARAGGTDVRTYIQSGNAVFSAAPAAASDIASRIRDDIEATFGYQVPVIVRGADELRRVVARNPFADTDKVHVVFLSAPPAADRANALDPNRSPADQFELVGAEVFVHYGAGAATSKLTHTYIERQLGVEATARNWRTTITLLDWVTDDGSP